ncbi:MAG: Mrp/NBP35 family ATP-binding protein [Chloroflexi bacterium]|nr:Mrp/NBP35 family ATP-binding protein [Chloroflexota bacterium]
MRPPAQALTDGLLVLLDANYQTAALAPMRGAEAERRRMTEERKPRTMSPQEQARLEAIKKSWQQRKQIGDRTSRIRHKIGVYSGKGGVGKTTVAVNIAVALAQQGLAVGLLDVDIDCPNAHRVIGAHEPPAYTDGIFTPAQAWGVKVMSMGFLQENEEEAIIMRGPMIHNVINQFLQSTEWGDLDYLVADLPPGTSDAPLTVMQTLQMDGFVVVTTPQSLAKLDAKRSINMIRKMNVPVLGVVENMSGDVFGKGAGEELAREMGTEFLGRLELRPDYRKEDRPTVLASKKVMEEYRVVVAGMERQLAALAPAATP